MSSEFSTLLRRYRTAAGLTQEGLAERSQLSIDAIGATWTGSARNACRGCQ
ncbi:helix-turn-helix domain-containing protein [Kribbella deserti]|uniref:Helix-turn-helix domain-containing protein n=1 Tax=Kribbella deserti TaxID=1926257 RepID=A0ABV6QJ79_9ACTN